MRKKRPKKKKEEEEEEEATEPPRIARREKREAKNTKSALASETRLVFAETVQQGLASLQGLWPDYEPITTAVKEWEAKITKAPSLLRSTRLGLIIAVLSQQLSSEVVGLLNKRDVEFFRRLETATAEAVESNEEAVASAVGGGIAGKIASTMMRSFSSSITEGKGDIIGALQLSRKAVEDMSEEDTATLYNFMDRLMQVICMSRVQSALGPGILNVVSSVQNSIEPGASLIDTIQQIQGQVTKIPESEMTEMTTCVTPEIVGLVARSMGGGSMQDILEKMSDGDKGELTEEDRQRMMDEALKAVGSNIDAAGSDSINIGAIASAMTGDGGDGVGQAVSAAMAMGGGEGGGAVGAAMSVLGGMSEAPAAPASAPVSTCTEIGHDWKQGSEQGIDESPLQYCARCGLEV